MGGHPAGAMETHCAAPRDLTVSECFTDGVPLCVSITLQRQWGVIPAVGVWAGMDRKPLVANTG